MTSHPFAILEMTLIMGPLEKKYNMNSTEVIKMTTVMHAKMEEEGLHLDLNLKGIWRLRI